MEPPGRGGGPSARAERLASCVCRREGRRRLLVQLLVLIQQLLVGQLLVLTQQLLVGQLLVGQLLVRQLLVWQQIVFIVNQDIDRELDVQLVLGLLRQSGATVGHQNGGGHRTQAVGGDGVHHRRQREPLEIWWQHDQAREHTVPWQQQPSLLVAPALLRQRCVDAHSLCAQPHRPWCAQPHRP